MVGARSCIVWVCALTLGIGPSLCAAKRAVVSEISLTKEEVFAEEDNDGGLGDLPALDKEFVNDPRLKRYRMMKKLARASAGQVASRIAQDTDQLLSVGFSQSEIGCIIPLLFAEDPDFKCVRPSIHVLDVTWVTQSVAWQKNKGRCCCNKPRTTLHPWEQSTFIRGDERSGICVIIKGSDSCDTNHGETVHDIPSELKGKTLQPHDSETDGMCTIPYHPPWTRLVKEEFGCASKVTAVGKVESQIPGHMRYVPCKEEADVIRTVFHSDVLWTVDGETGFWTTCRPNGMFDPAPECFDGWEAYAKESSDLMMATLQARR